MPDAPSRFQLEGELTKDEVPDIWRRSLNWQTEGTPATIDLGGVGQADASGVALLLEWTAWARQRGESIRFENAPEGLTTIAALSQVNGLLGLTEAPKP